MQEQSEVIVYIRSLFKIWSEICASDAAVKNMTYAYENLLREIRQMLTFVVLCGQLWLIKLLDKSYCYNAIRIT